MCSFVYGSHTAAQYSKDGLTSEWCATLVMSSVHLLKLRLIKPSEQLRLATMWSTCLFHLRLFDNSTPILLGEYELVNREWEFETIRVKHFLR